MTRRILQIAMISPVASLPVLAVLVAAVVFTVEPGLIPADAKDLISQSSMINAAPHQTAATARALPSTQGTVQDSPAKKTTAPATSQAPQAPQAPRATVAAPAGPRAGTTTCPAGQLVTTAAELSAALASAVPGSVVVMASGTYAGNFTVTVSGTQAAPITLCGPADAIIDGGTKSRVFHLNGANWWQLIGFQIQHGNKGLGLTHASNNVISGLYIHDTAGASVHVNSFSSDNLFDGLTLRNTPKEGFYIGSTQSNWCMYSNCQPDASDRNVIQNSDVAGTGSEPVNLQEGATGGKVLNNRLDGTAIVKAKEWVNVKGNGYLIAGNVGTNSPKDGFDVHQTATGWGNDNVFDSNQANVNGPGYAFYIQAGTTGNVVRANNTATGAGRGLANVPLA